MHLAGTLADNVAVVTGGGRGIGLATAEELGLMGATVVLAEREEELGLKAQAHLDELGLKSLHIRTDVTDPASVLAMVDRTVGLFGRLDVLVNNAGITADRTLRKMAAADWARVLDVNLTGVFNCTQAVAQQMVDQGSGVIITLSSVVRSGAFGQANYSATKAGAVAFMNTVARELGPKGVRALCVAPGFTRTDMGLAVPAENIAAIEADTPLRRMAEPAEIARVVAFMASPLASFVTGAVIPVDGGLVV